MKRPWRLALLFAVLLPASLPAGPSFPEPDSETLMAEMKSTNPLARTRAALQLQWTEPHTPKMAAALVFALRDPDARVRLGAAQSLGGIGPITPEVVPALIAAALDMASGSSAVSALASIGKPALPEVLKSLESKDALARARAYEVLARMGRGAREAAPRIVSAMTDPSNREAWRAAAALSEIDPDDKRAVPVLIEALGSPDAQTRLKCLEALERHAGSARGAVPAAAALLKDRRLDVAPRAAALLEKIGTQDAVDHVRRFRRGRKIATWTAVFIWFLSLGGALYFTLRKFRRAFLRGRLVLTPPGLMLAFVALFGAISLGKALANPGSFLLVLFFLTRVGLMALLDGYILFFAFLFLAWTGILLFPVLRGMPERASPKDIAFGILSLVLSAAFFLAAEVGSFVAGRLLYF
jgi:hypothetical protein